MHVSAIISKNTVRINKIQRALTYESDTNKIVRLKDVLAKIKKRQLELVKIELRMGGPYKR